MPNWCSATVVYYVEKEEHIPALKAFYADINKALRAPSRCKNSFNPPERWLGNIVDYFGAYALIDQQPDGVRCRGYVTWIGGLEDDEKAFRLDVEEAGYVDHLDFMRKVLEEKYPDIQMVFCAEEPGSDIFVNTDREGKYFPDRYKFEYGDLYGDRFSDVSPDEMLYFENFEQMQDFLRKMFGKVPEDPDHINEFIEELENEFPDAFFAIRCFDFS